jgi:hypothetical protein
LEPEIRREKLPSGKLILRQFSENGSLVSEQHLYGALDVGISLDFKDGAKIGETYFVKRRLVSRRSYEKARFGYSDMPAADSAIEDTGSALLKGAREQQRRNSEEARRRLAESAEARFPRPASTNWLRVITSEKSHLVIFASRDWKVLCREPRLPTGKEWLRLFGFFGSPGQHSIAKGLEIGFEIVGDGPAMLQATRSLLSEVNAFVAKPSEISALDRTFRYKPKKVPPLAWPTVLPPLIDFLSALPEREIKVFNHHR